MCQLIIMPLDRRLFFFAQRLPTKVLQRIVLCVLESGDYVFLYACEC